MTCMGLSKIDGSGFAALGTSKQMKDEIIQKYLDIAGVIIVALNKQGNITLINKKGCEILGYDESDLIGKNWFEHCLPEKNRQEMQQLFRQWMNGKVTLAEYYDNPVLTKKGKQRIISWQNTLLNDDAGRPTGTLSSGLDVTERKQAEASLKESEARLRAIVETAVDGIITIDVKGMIESFNLAAEKLFGYSADEVLGSNVGMLMPSPYREEHDGYIQNYLKTGKKKIIGIGREVVGLRKDGATFPMRLAVSELKLGKRILFTGIARDISEQKSLQDQILQTERLAIIGKMAAKVAHEIRNPLSSISLNAELLEDEIQSYENVDKKEALALLKSMIREIDRVTSLTDEYLQFSRLPEPHPIKGDLVELIQDSMELLVKELSRKNIKFEFKHPPVSTQVRYDRAQMRRVLLNIIRNAIEAMPKGGKLMIEIDNTEHHALINIIDTGTGIPEQEVANIFDPFFTTKDFGTGLGLTISQQIIQEHGGNIYCQSKLGHGTTFKIELPLDQKQ